MNASTTPAWQAKVSFEDKFNIVEGDPLGFKAWAGYMYNSPTSSGGRLPRTALPFRLV